MVICLEQGADLHMAQLMPLPLTVSCFSKIQIGFTFLVPAHPGIPGQRAIKRMSVCVCKQHQVPVLDAGYCYRCLSASVGHTGEQRNNNSTTETPYRTWIWLRLSNHILADPSERRGTLRGVQLADKH